jgi:hypothetical protein
MVLQGEYLFAFSGEAKAGVSALLPTEVKWIKAKTPAMDSLINDAGSSSSCSQKGRAAAGGGFRG